MAQAKVDTKMAIEEINKLINSYTKLVEATGQVSTISQGNFKKVEQALAALKIMTDQATKSIDKMTDAQKQELAVSRARTKGAIDATDALKKEAKAVQEVVDAQKKLENQSNKVVTAFKGVFNGVSQLIAAFGVVAGLKLFADIIKNAYNLTKQFNSLSFALKKITDDSFDYAVSQRYLIELTESFGVNLVKTAERWVKFLAASKQAGVTLRDTENIFRSLTKAGAVLGLQTDDLKSVYLALEQMMSKGKVTTEELRRQLGEKLPGAVGIMAAAVGVNVNQLDKMLKKGEVLSAEVLPKFAKALELAYGIQNVDRIDNIESAQNRLINSWQMFIKTVSEGNVVIEASLNWIAEKLNSIASIFLTEEQKMQLKIIENKKNFEEDLFELSKKRFDKTLAEGMKYNDIVNKIEDDRQKLQESKDRDLTKKQRDALQQKLNEDIQVLTKYEEEILKIQKKTASNNIEGIRKQYDIQMNIIKQARRDQQELADLDAQEGITNVSSAETAATTAARRKLERLTAILEVYRKLQEESKAVGFQTDPAKGKAIPTKTLDTITDLTNERKKAELNSLIQINDAILAEDKSTSEERQRLIVDNFNLRLQLTDNQYNEDLEKAKAYHDKELDELIKAQVQGKTIIDSKGNVVKDTEQYIADIEKNYADAKAIAEAKRNDSSLASERQYSNDKIKIAERREDLLIRDAEDKANEQILLANEVYANSSKTAKDKAALDKKMNEIAIEQANAIIDIKIETLKILREEAGLTEVELARIDSMILKLEASRKTLSPDKDKKKGLTETQQNLIELYEFIGEFSNSINDLGQAVFDRKIENINAEINAEKDKYDRLIDLARGNKDEQIRLQTERDAKIKALEERRLKEERKKAIFDKANALIQIAVNTAVAITKAAAQTGVGFVVSTPLLVALGALQAAAVIAQPLPKYKDGLANAQRDHIGMINDGTEQEYVERGNSILTTKTKNAIINLKKGDTVHKSYDDMVNGSDMFGELSRSILLNNIGKNVNSKSQMDEIFDRHLKGMKDDIKKGIHDGFNKVTINSVTKIDMDWIAYKNDTL
jgi:tape measure domain-containing protein